MNNYGTDKPDLRISSCIRDVTSIVKQDKTSRIVQKVFDDKHDVDVDVRVKCVKFEAKSFREIPTSNFLNREVPEIANK
jgi:aspartyl-tRNA synthetase